MIEVTPNNFVRNAYASNCTICKTFFYNFLQFCPDEVKNCDRLRLSTICRMLQTPLFSSKMNALKEVSRLIDESEQTQSNFSGGKRNNSAMLNIGVDEVVEWMAVSSSLMVKMEQRNLIQYILKFFVFLRLKTKEN